MISPGVREPDGAVTLAGAGAAAGSAGRGRGTIAGAGVLSVASTGFVVGTSASFAGFVERRVLYRFRRNERIFEHGGWMRAGLHEQDVGEDGDRGERADREARHIPRAPSQRPE